MKTAYLAIIAIMILLLVPAMVNNPAKAGCLVPTHADWPNTPCYGCPGCIPSKEKQREDWNPYYQYKGASWMEMMKAQMINAMRNGTIEDWVTGNDSHYNVWRYYYLNDQAPFFRSSVSGLNDEHPYFPPPLQQLTTGITSKDVACKKGLDLIIKSEDSSPACVKPATVQILIERGWAINQTPNLKTSGVNSIRIIPENQFTTGIDKNGTITEFNTIEILFDNFKPDNSSLTIKIFNPDGGIYKVDNISSNNIQPDGFYKYQIYIKGNTSDMGRYRISVTYDNSTAWTSAYLSNAVP